MPARDPDADPSELSEQLGLDHEHPLSVTQLTMCIKGLVEQSLPQVWLEGEVSDLSRPSSGHLYLTLKDQQCQIRAVMWRSAAQRLPFRLEDGQAIICSGAVEVYPPRGTYQLVISRVQPKGVGSLQLAFEQLHKRLASEGLFDVDRKRHLPAFPTRLAFVTSPSGAAIHDFIEAARQRWPALELMIIPAKVQGAGAVEDIVRGIQVAARLRPRPEILIVGRGGGSLEDLWCFNDERVVRALAASPIPTVSAVGHEVDVTLSDLVADVRALTPTQAAQVCLPSRSEVASFLEQARTRMLASCKNRILHARQRLTQLSHSRMLASPYEVINVRRQQIDEWEVRARQAMWQGWHRQRERVQGVARAAHALSPLQVLSRGFSLTADATNGKLLRSADELVIGQTVHTVLEHGSFTSNIVAIDRAATMATPSTDSPGNRVASSAAAIRPIDPSRSRKRSSS